MPLSVYAGRDDRSLEKFTITGESLTPAGSQPFSSVGTVVHNQRVDVRSVGSTASAAVIAARRARSRHLYDAARVRWLLMTPKLDMLGIVAHDLAASLAFYRLLGFDIPEGSENESHVEITLPNGLRIAWDPVSTIQSFDSSWVAPSGSPRTAFAFLCDSPAEVDAAYQRLVAAGAHSHLAPWDAFWGQRYATVHDPDGNGVDLFAELM